MINNNSEINLIEFNEFYWVLDSLGDSAIVNVFNFMQIKLSLYLNRIIAEHGMHALQWWNVGGIRIPGNCPHQAPLRN